MAYDRGHVVLVPFPFTNLAGAKALPALIVSNSRFNTRDVVAVAITSQVRLARQPLAIEIPKGTDRLQAMGLRVASAVLVGKLVSLDQTLVYRTIGRADQELLEEVEARLRLLLDIK